jgi:hypothetical protein
MVSELVVYVVTTRRRSESLFPYVLRANHLAADYYPNNDSDIRSGEVASWFMAVANRMGNVQLAMIRVRLGNQTISPPNESQALPSPAPTITEFERFIQNNETWEIPFIWQISNATTTNGSTEIVELRINNQTFHENGLSGQNGYNYQFIIELWTWNEDSASLQFGWLSGSEHRVAWLQICLYPSFFARFGNSHNRFSSQSYWFEASY